MWGGVGCGCDIRAGMWKAGEGSTETGATGADGGAAVGGPGALAAGAGGAGWEAGGGTAVLGAQIH